MQGMLPISEGLSAVVDDQNNILKIFYGFSLIHVVNLNDKLASYVNAVNLVLSGYKEIDIAKN